MHNDAEHRVEIGGVGSNHDQHIHVGSEMPQGLEGVDVKPGGKRRVRSRGMSRRSRSERLGPSEGRKEGRKEPSPLADDKLNRSGKDKHNELADGHPRPHLGAHEHVFRLRNVHQYHAYHQGGNGEQERDAKVNGPIHAHNTEQCMVGTRTAKERN